MNIRHVCVRNHRLGGLFGRTLFSVPIATFRLRLENGDSNSTVLGERNDLNLWAEALSHQDSMDTRKACLVLT